MTQKTKKNKGTKKFHCMFFLGQEVSFHAKLDVQRLNQALPGEGCKGKKVKKQKPI